MADSAVAMDDTRARHGNHSNVMAAVLLWIVDKLFAIVLAEWINWKPLFPTEKLNMKMWIMMGLHWRESNKWESLVMVYLYTNE
jgi:hypothetical protein